MSDGVWEHLLGLSEMLTVGRVDILCNVRYSFSELTVLCSLQALSLATERGWVDMGYNSDSEPSESSQDGLVR